MAFPNVKVMLTMGEEIDWSQWSRDATQLMSRRNDEWRSKYQLASASYFWDMNSGVITFRNANHTVCADICVVGSTSISEGTFLWSWANETIPHISKERIYEVRTFGETHDLPLLVDAEWPGTKEDGLEMLTVSSRILDAEGAWVAPVGDVTLLFALLNFNLEN